MNFAKTFSVALVAASIASVCSAQSLQLGIDPRFYDLDNAPPGYYPSNPQSLTMTSGTNGVATSIAIADRGGFLTASSTLTASILDANHGILTYNDGFNVTNAPIHSNYAMGAGSFSSSWSNLTFTSATAVNVTVNWTSVASGLINGGLDPVNGGLQNIWIILDGTQASTGFAFAQSSGTFSLNVGAGNHTLTFLDGSNNGLSHAATTQTANIQETLHYSIQAVPEPTTLAAFGLGLAALIRRKRRA